jgi:uncharacterized protein (DUF2236 family)
MLIFAGAAAEFALSKAVDWLFWTNRLPRAPIERFFETARFAQELVFGDTGTAATAIEAINRAHAGVERGRGATIPNWAYRHVLAMLIDYGERAHRVVFGPMSAADRQQHFELMRATGQAMRIDGLPESYVEFQTQRREHLHQDIAYTRHTAQLYARYRQHLGAWRFGALLRLQAGIAPPEVTAMLGLQHTGSIDLVLKLYRHLPRRRLLALLYPVMLPRQHGRQLAALDRGQ